MATERLDAAALQDLAARSAMVQRTFPASEWRRADGLIAPVHEIPDVQLAAQFVHDPEGRVVMHVSLRGDLPLICQRCLTTVIWPVSVDAPLTIVSDPADSAELEDPFDSVLLAPGGLNLAAVAEDELLAALPLAPVHADEKQCSPEGLRLITGKDAGPRVTRPFAELQNMLDARHSADGDS